MTLDMDQNPLKALASDLVYLEAWCQLVTGSPLLAPESLPRTIIVSP